MDASSMGTLRRATLVLLLAALIWGSMIPVLAALAQHYDKWLLSWLRYLLGMPVLWLALAMTPRPAPRRDRCASSGCCNSARR
jgi:drug/metabolite transporter (DMT)-like permease